MSCYLVRNIVHNDKELIERLGFTKDSTRLGTKFILIVCFGMN